MGVPIEASSAFQEGAAQVTPIVGKLKIQIGDYHDHEEFLITSKSLGYDVLLGMPWHHRMQPQPNFRDKSMTLSVKGNKKVCIDASTTGDTIPMVGHVALKGLMKKSISAYLIFVKDSKLVKAENQSFNHAFLSCFNDCVKVGSGR